MAQKLVYFNSRDTLIRIDISQVAYFEGDGNYTYVVTANKLKSWIIQNRASAGARKLWFYKNSQINLDISKVMCIFAA